MDRAAFFQALREGSSGLFTKGLSKEQVRGIEGIVEAMEEVGDGRAKTLAYALATAYHETCRRMVPVREGLAATDEEARAAVAALAKKRGPCSAPARYIQPSPPYGHCYYGRGHVQLTWRENYVRSSADAGVDLEAEPDAMLDPVVSARVLVRGLIDGRWNGKGRGIAHYLPDGGPDDLQNARRTVNGTDKWEMIAAHYKAFLHAIEAGGGWMVTGEGVCPVSAEAEALAAPHAIAAVRPMARPAPAAAAFPGAELAAWLAECPGDPQAIGQWLARVPAEVRRTG
jgi:hypothetical protein